MQKKIQNDMETGIIRGLSNWVGQGCRDFAVWGLLEVKRFSLIELQLVAFVFIRGLGLRWRLGAWGGSQKANTGRWTSRSLEPIYKG